jgi:YebC/PmpR family DNA-binding regulatory protein
MGAQWKQKWRELSALKRGQLFGKLVKEILVAAKAGGPDPDLNARLYAALEAARKQSVPRETIERAVKRGAGLTGESISYELATYEGFAPHKVPVIVECLTDNRNRTAPEVRVLFKEGQLGAIGSVAWMFNHVGLVEAHRPAEAGLDLEAVAIEAGAQGVEPLESEDVPAGRVGARFTCDRPDLDAVGKFLAAAKWTVLASEMSYVAKDPVELPPEKRAEVAAFLEALDGHDDVHRVYAAMK